MRPGWGVRNQAVDKLLANATPIDDDRIVFGVTELVRTAYGDDAELPDDLTLSVRCIVTVGDQFVVCTNLDGASHPWPGGRREHGESFADTAAREVYEETGWLIRRETLRKVGWMHFSQQSPMVDANFPWPDFFQVVFAASAVDRAAEDWTDTEGYEASSQLMSFDDAYAAINGDALARVFLDRL